MLVRQGEILKKLIKEKGFRQQDFADLMGVTRTYLINTLFNKKEFKPDLLDTICAHLNVPKSIFDVVNIESAVSQEQPPHADMEFIYKERIDDLKFTIQLLKDQISTDRELQEIKSLLKKMNVRV